MARSQLKAKKTAFVGRSKPGKKALVKAHLKKTAKDNSVVSKKSKKKNGKKKKTKVAIDLHLPSLAVTKNSKASNNTSNGFASYKDIVRNRYQSKAQRAAVCRDLDTAHLCHCKEECDQNCQNRRLFMECALNECPSLKNGNCYCANTALQRRAFPVTEIFQTKSCGHGLKICEDVEAGTILLEYTGEVISAEECTRRRHLLKANEDFYFASLCCGYMLDAKPMGSKARFANHSCRPNCELQKWMVLGEPVLALVAVTDIKGGSELTYNYHCNEDNATKHRMIRQICKCGSSNCSGVIGGKVLASVDDKWVQRAENLLNQEKTNHVSAVRTHLEGASDHSIPQYEGLKCIVQDVENWIKKYYQPLFSPPQADEETAAEQTLPKLYSVNELSDIVALYPLSNIKCDEYLHLLTVIKQSPKLSKRIEQCLAHVGQMPVEQQPVGGPIELSNMYPQETLEPRSNTFHDTDWNSFLALLKDIDSAVPLKCGGNGHVAQLLQMYQRVSIWAEQIYKRTRSPKRCEDWEPKRSSPWVYISRLATYYNQKVTPYAIMLEVLLDFQVSLYIKRAQLLRDPVLSKSNAPSSHDGLAVLNSMSLLNVDLGVDPTLPMAFDELNDVREKDSGAGRDEYTLHCVCRLPETDGETMTLVQCDSCGTWYHPLCINRRELDEDYQTKQAKRENFMCPCCEHMQNGVCSLASPSSGEWFDKFLLRKKKKSSSLFIDFTEASSNSEIVALKPQISLDSQMYCRKIMESGLGLLLDEDKELIRNEFKLLGVQKHCSSGGSKSTENRPSTDSELMAYLEKSSYLPFSNVTVVLLLQLISSYVLAWKNAVDLFLNDTERFFNRNIDSILAITTEGIVDREVSESELQMECEMIMRAQFLYSCTRLISIAVPSKMLKLRLLIWTLSAGCLLRRKNERKMCLDKDSMNESIDRNVSSISCLAFEIMANQRSHSEDLLSLDDLVDAIRSGRSILESISSRSETGQLWYSGQYGTLGHAAWSTLRILDDLLRSCLSAFRSSKYYMHSHGQKPLIVILRSLLGLSKIIEMRQVFSVARVLNMSLFMESLAQVDVSDHPDLTTSKLCDNCVPKSAEVPLCWCRGDEFGKMICCDECNIWFHNACMGLSKRVSVKNISDFLCISCSEMKGLQYCYEWVSKW